MGIHIGNTDKLSSLNIHNTANNCAACISKNFFLFDDFYSNEVHGQNSQVYGYTMKLMT